MSHGEWESEAELLGRILDESLNEIYIFDADSLRFVRVNRGGRENLGYSMAELRDMTPLDIKPELTPASFEALVEPLRTGERGEVRFETVHQRADGSRYPIEVNLQRATEGARPLFVAVILDITERRKAEEERERLIAELEEANVVKSEFVSTMSHELRTPLNAILGYAQLLADGVDAELPEAALARVHRIIRSGRHLLQLIDEILTFSRLEAGRTAVTPLVVDVPELLAEVRAVLEPLAEAKALDLSVEYAELPPRFVSDPKKIRQVLLNLAVNALKFTASGRVAVRVTGCRGGVVLRVEDTGVGMTEAELGRAGEPFWQADQTPTREAGGTGLGLSITYRFVGLLGGEVRTRSERGRGTTMEVWLPDLDGATAAEG